MSVFTLFRQTIQHNLKPRGVYSWHPTLSQQDPASRGGSECASSVFFHYRSVLLCPPSPLPGMGVPACPAAKVTVQKTWWTGGLQPGDQVQGNLTVLILSYYDAFPCGQGAPADDILCAKLKVEARGTGQDALWPAQAASEKSWPKAATTPACKIGRLCAWTRSPKLPKLCMRTRSPLSRNMLMTKIKYLPGCMLPTQPSWAWWCHELVHMFLGQLHPCKKRPGL